MTDSMQTSPAVPSVLPPESARDFLANGMLALRANTSFSPGSAFQPAETYERAMALFQQAIDKLDQERSCER